MCQNKILTLKSSLLFSYCSCSNMLLTNGVKYQGLYKKWNVTENNTPFCICSVAKEKMGRFLICKENISQTAYWWFTIFFNLFKNCLKNRGTEKKKKKPTMKCFNCYKLFTCKILVKVKFCWSYALLLHWYCTKEQIGVAVIPNAYLYLCK